MKKNKKIKQLDPFKNLVLDEYEKELEESFEKDEWVVVDNQAEVKKMWIDAAARHKELQKAKKITLRVNQRDLIKLKVKANSKNIPYQTLLGALIRDFVTGDYSIKI